MRPSTVLFACLALFWTATASQSAEISGAWKIDTRGGPTPLCSLVQVDGNLNGSCVGPQATGTVTGTIIGTQVRWRWQWVSYVGKAAAFDFAGVLGADNTITGTVKRRDIGMLLNFVAKRQMVTSGQSVTPPAPQGGTLQPLGDFIAAFNRRNNTNLTFGPGGNRGKVFWSSGAGPAVSPAAAALAAGGYAQQNGYRTIIDQNTVGTGNPQYRWQAIPPPVQNDPNDPFGQFDQQDVATALAMFPGQGPRMWQWLKDQKNIQLDRQQGNSYSIGVR